MSAPYYQVLRGAVAVVGRTPDGDSVRFIADDPARYAPLRHAHRIRLGRDGGVQLRFEGIDAPEAHYGRAAQRGGDLARDRLLAALGFGHVRFEPSDPARVATAEPESVRATVLTAAADANGRPIAYVFAGKPDTLDDRLDWVRLDPPALDTTLNAHLLAEGLAYPTVYTSTPLDHRRALRAIAAEARGEARGVWALDATGGFDLRDAASIGPNGRLILPKLFRRATDYLQARADGYRGGLIDWLTSGAGPLRRENDRVVLDETVEVSLSSLLDQRNRRVVFQADLLAITFVER